MKTIVFAALAVLSLGVGVGVANATPPSMHHKGTP
jgi:hypothetical protein